MNFVELPKLDPVPNLHNATDVNKVGYGVMSEGDLHIAVYMGLGVTPRYQWVRISRKGVTLEGPEMYGILVRIHNIEYEIDE